MVRRVALSVAKVVFASLTALAVSAATASAQHTQSTAGSGPIVAAALDVAALGQIATTFSNDCKVTCAAYQHRSALRSVRRALRENRTVRVLAVGSSSTVGMGASSPVASYPVRLETALESFIKGLDVEVIARGVNGEIAKGAAERLKLEVADTKPDLVVWQVGTNDAMARIGEAEFADLLRSTIRWLRLHRVDVVLIDPQYVERLATDAHYKAIVSTIQEIAKQERALLVNRYDTMADLAKQKGNQAFLASDRFHLNDLGYRCMAEYAARAIIAGVVDAEREPNVQPQP